VPIKATLRDDNTLELPEDAPRLAWADAPLSVIDLGGSALVVTESDPQVPPLSEQFRSGLEEVGVTEEELLGELERAKRELAEEGPADGSE
jgi:hypothetical protein